MISFIFNFQHDYLKAKTAKLIAERQTEGTKYSFGFSFGESSEEYGQKESDGTKYGLDLQD